MPSSFPVPDYPVTVFASPQDRKRIAAGATLYVDGQPLQQGESVIVDHAVEIMGPGGHATVEEMGPAPPPKPKPKPKAKPKPKPKAEKPKKKAKAKK